MIFKDNLICLPVEADTGLKSVLGDHFRSAGYHFLYDTDSGDWEVVESPRYERGRCRSSGDLVRPKVASVLARGIGRHAYLSMMKQGVSIWMTHAQTVGEALHAWRSGFLVPLLESQLGDHTQHCKKGRSARGLPNLRETRNQSYYC